MRWIVMLSVASLAVAGCAGKQKIEPKKVVKQVKKEVEPAHTQADVQAAFDGGVTAMTAQPPDLEAAKKQFEAALKATHNFPEAHFNLGMVHAREGSFNDAEREYKTALDQFPDTARRNVRLTLAKFYVDRNRLPEAESVLQQLLMETPDDLIIKQNMAVLYRSMKDFETALKFVREILSREAKNIAALNTLGLIYLDQDNMSMAEWIFGKATQFSKSKPNPDVLNSLGLFWLKKRKTPAAVAHFQKAVGANPNHLPARKNLGALYVNFLNYAGGVEQYQAALKLAPYDVDARMGLAASYFGLGQHEQAANEYKRIVEQKPRSGDAFARLGRLYQEFIRDQPKALEYYKEYIRVANPPANDPIVQQIGFLEEAVRRGVAKEPEPPKEKERPKRPLGDTSAMGLDGVSVEEALTADPDAPTPDVPEEGAAPENGAVPVEGGAPPAEGAAPPAAAPAAAPPAEPTPPAAAPAAAPPAKGAEKGGK